MSEPDVVADLNPDREVYVGATANVGGGARAHLHNDGEKCWYTGDLRAVDARVLFDDQPVCKICSGRDRKGSNQYEDVPAIEDDEHNTTGVKWG